MATTLTHFRARDDDGNETTATWKANEDGQWIQPVDVNFRIRHQVQNDTSAINNLDVQLQYSLNGGAFTNVNATSSVVRSSASANLADAANLTRQLAVGTGTFQGATAFDEVNGICGGNSLDVLASGYFETEFCVQLRSADVVNGDKIRLRTINSDSGNPWTTYNVMPEMTATGPAVSDSPTATEATTITGVLSLSVSDSPTVTEDAVLTGAGVQNITLDKFDAPTASEFVDLFITTLFISVADSPTATESLSLAIPSSLSAFDFAMSGAFQADAFQSSAFQVAEAIQITAAASLSKFEAPTVTESTAVVSVASLSVADSPVATDVPNVVLTGGVQNIPVDVFDASTATEATVITAVASLSVSDSPTATEATSVTAATSLSVFDSAVATDAASISSIASISVADAPVATEASSITAVTSLVVFDAPIASEAEAVTMTLAVLISDAPIASEATSLTVVTALVAFDAPIATEFVNLFLDRLFIVVADSPIASEFQQVTRFGAAAPSVGDDPVVTEAVEIFLTKLFASVFDAPIASEAASISAAASIALDDTTVVTEAALLTGVTSLSVADASTVVEFVNIGTTVLFVESFDLPSVTESVSIEIGVVRVIKVEVTSRLIAGVGLTSKVRPDISIDSELTADVQVKGKYPLEAA